MGQVHSKFESSSSAGVCLRHKREREELKIMNWKKKIKNKINNVRIIVLLSNNTECLRYNNMNKRQGGS